MQGQRSEGVHQEIYVDDGGGWRKAGTRDSPYGKTPGAKNAMKSSTKPVHNYQAQFRTDCHGISYNCAYVRQITGKGSAYALSMGVPLNGYTNSPRMRKSFYTTHSGYSKAYRAKISGLEKSSFQVTIEHNQAIDNPMTDTEREDSHWNWLLSEHNFTDECRRDLK